MAHRLRGAVALAAAALLAVTAAGCGDGDADGGTVKITWWHGQAAPYDAPIKKLAAEYSKAHPGVRIEPQLGTSNVDDMLQKVTAALAGGDAPDIAYMYGSWTASLAENRKVVDMTDTVKDPSFGWSDFWESERAAATVDGKVVGVPAVVDNLGVVYNKKLFDAAHVAYPKPDWTWDDFRAAAKKLTDPGKSVYGTAYPVSGGEDTVWRLWPMLWQQGGGILTPDNKKAAFNTPQAAAALDLWRGMARDDKSVYLDQNGEKFLPLFQSGKVAMVVTGPFALLDFKEHGIDYGAVPLPGYNGNHETISGPDFWVLFDNGSRRAKAAKEFAAWLSKPEQDARWSLAVGNLPLRKATTQLPEYKKYVDDFPGAAEFVANLDNAKKARPSSAAYAKFSEAVGNAITKSLIAGDPASQTLGDAAKKTDDLLAKEK
ncbi:ABC transporter substrate-binding protein [Actinomadura darangshiensis]|uniref:ABC transporter substrate-binding protein n=1 Tax=Actinomadura darangshiensis TaxID=705336 RepID=A0A4R5BK37_9ACTN|nr:ABC transporter substrate-binding protein [Actinomadura darangshiensis]TDD86185.1 ABC transporter substrate-binding protein [Actinomadura darangshiensis]